MYELKNKYNIKIYDITYNILGKNNYYINFHD